jgi:transcription elongation factor Elf1
MKAHRREKAFTCSKCNKSFLYSKSLERHVEQMHNNSKSLERHVEQMHNNSKSLEHHVEQMHNNSTSLERHVEQMHNTTSTFSCPVCNKSFSLSTRLDIHLKIHF